MVNLDVVKIKQTKGAILMAKKKPKSTPATPKKAMKYNDPCFHCENMELLSTGMACKKNAPAFWNDEQGLEIDAKGLLTGEMCKQLSEFPKPLKPPSV